MKFFAIRSALAIGLLIAPLACKREDGGAATRSNNPKTLSIYIWSEYLPQGVIDKFTAKTGIKVTVDTYENNEVLLSKLQSGVARYDLCVPSDYMVKTLINQKLIQAVDPAKVPNLKNIEARFLNRPFDPGNKYSVPYLWGTTGYGYNTQQIKEKLDSWAPMFDPKYSGKILMLNDAPECFAAALKSMGKSLNEKDSAVLRQAADKLKAQKKLVKTYNSEDYDNILASGDVWLAHAYNGQIAKLARREKGKFAYVLPKEGATVSMDGMCIPAKARNATAAMEFMNFVHEPEIAAEIVNGTNYAGTNEAAKKYINPEILNDPAVYPPPELLKNCEFMEDRGEMTQLIDRLWTEIKAQ